MSKAVEGLLWETRRLFRVLATAADEALQPLNITASDRALIEFLAREPHPISLAELARKRSVSRQHIHQSITRLPNPRWIDKQPDPDDARSVLLHLTPEGQSLWKEIKSIDRAILRRISKHIRTYAAHAAAATLREVREALEEESHD
jgi:DNA-binding MarR family transcriptional regulator